MLRINEWFAQPFRRAVALPDRPRSQARPGSRFRQLLVTSALVLSLLLLTVPLFVDIYRQAAFNTAPRDDYAPMLLALIGDRGEPPLRQPDLLASAPFGYRFLSVAVAVPFYYTMPFYEFSNVEHGDLDYLRATQALALVSYLSIVATALVVYWIAHRRFDASVASSVIVAMLAVALTSFVSRTGVDPLAILMLSLLIAFMRNVPVFAALMLLSAAMNEKLLIIMGALLVGRLAALLWQERRAPEDAGGRGAAPWRFQRLVEHGLGYQALALAGSLAIYLGMRLFIGLAGDAHRSDSRLWLPKALTTLADTLSLKGMVANGIPLAILAVLIVLALWAYRRWPAARDYFQPTDVFVFVVLVAVALIINSRFTAGRLVMHSFPIYLPLAARFIDAQLGLMDRSRGG